MAPQIARRVADIGGSVFSRLTPQLAAARHPVAPLHVGDTYLRPPAGCALHELSPERLGPLNRYIAPQGDLALRQAIAARSAAPGGAPIDPEQVVVTPGATGALSAIAAATLEPGDEVIVLSPYWPLIVGLIRAHGGRPVEVPVLGPGPALLERVAAAIGPRTVAIYLNSPNNPTGEVHGAARLAGLAELARQHDLWIWSDEVYAELSYVGPPPRAVDAAPERTISVGSFSKAYGMAGHRCGWALLPPSPALRDALWKTSTHQSYGAPTASQAAALRALEQGGPWLDAARAAYEAAGRAAAARLGLPPPAAGTFLFVDVSAALRTDLDEEDALHDFLVRCLDQGVLLAPGRSCGAHYGRYVRLCFTAAPPEAVASAVDRLAALIAAG